MAASIDDDPVVLHLRTEIQKALREGLRERGLAEPAQLQAEMARRQRRGQDFVPGRTWRRYLDPRSHERIPIEPKEASQRSLATIAELAGSGTR